MSIDIVAWIDKDAQDKLYSVEFYNKYKDCEVGTAGFYLINGLVPLYPQSAIDELQHEIEMLCKEHKETIKQYYKITDELQRHLAGRDLIIEALKHQDALIAAAYLSAADICISLMHTSTRDGYNLGCHDCAKEIREHPFSTIDAKAALRELCLRVAKEANHLKSLPDSELGKLVDKVLAE